MKRELKRREIALLLVLTVVLLGLVYYQFIYKSVKNAETEYDTTEIENEILAEETKSAQKKRMLAEIEANKDENKIVESYDNIKNEINELNDIFADSESFSFSYDTPTANDDAVRRPIAVVFTAKDYATAKSILTKLSDSYYRCLITDLSVNTASLQGYASGDNIASGPVSVSLNVTFYETLYNATTTDGLQIEEESTAADNSNLGDDLAADKERAESTGE